MDNDLLQQYAKAVRVRKVLNLLPAGVREWSLQFEQAAFSDLQGQAEKPATEDELLAMTDSEISVIIKETYPIVLNVAVDLLKKYFPTAAVTGVLSVIATYLSIK